MGKPSFKLKDSPQKQSTGRTRWIILGLVLLVVIAAGGYWLFFHQQENTQPNLNDEAQIETAKDKLLGSKNNSEEDNTNLPDSSVYQTSDQVPKSEKISISITSTDQKNGTVNAAAAVTGTSNNGSCVFSYTSEDRPVIKQVVSTENTCTVSIPEVEFTKLGSWNLNVTYYEVSEKAEANQRVEIQ